MLLQNHTNNEKESKTQSIKPKINPLLIKKIEDYTEIIPQKIENKLIQNTVSEETIINIEENSENQYLEFSFGKEIQKDKIMKNKNNSEKTEANNTNNANNINNTNNNNFTFRKQYNDPKNQDKYNILDTIDMFSDNVSSFQLTDSLSNFRDSYMEGNKKLQLIKDKFLSNFKNKERTRSLEKALMLFEKYQNYQKANNNQLNDSLSNLINKPLNFWDTQKTHNMSIFPNNENNNENNNDNNKDKDTDKNTCDNLSTNYVSENNDNYLNNNDINKNDIINYNNNKDTDKKDGDKKTIDQKAILQKLINKQKEIDKNKNKTLSNRKDGKKKGYFIRKIIREEKYVVDNDGNEKILGIKQSTIDTQDKNQDKNLSNNGLKNSINFNMPLLNKEKFTEFFNNKIAHTKNGTNSLSLQSRKKINNNNKKIEINTEFINNNNNNNNNHYINNNTISTDGYNNIKIVINKINKINTNPKINLNFIKKYNIKKTKEQKDSTPNNDNSNDNIGYQTQTNNKNIFRLIKNDNIKKNKIEEYKQPIRLNTNFNSYKNKMQSLDKGNIKILKCEKFADNKSYVVPFTNTISSFSYQKAQNTDKRNYSYKEIRNLSNTSNNSKSLDNYNYETEPSLTNGGLNNSNFTTKKYQSKIVHNMKMDKNKTNHAFYESKSFSNKKLNEKKHKFIEKYNNNSYYEFTYESGSNTSRYSKGNNTKFEKINYNINPSKSINPNRNYYYQCAMSNYKDMKKK